MATPRNVTTLLQDTIPNDSLIRLGDDMYLFDTAQDKYVRLVTASSVVATNDLLERLLIVSQSILDQIKYVTELNLGED